MREQAKPVLAVLAVIVVAGLFWIVLISPKRDKANELSERVTAVSAEVASDQAQLTTATAARRNFAAYYGKLVVLGKAVPPEDGTASLLVQLQGIAERANTSFVSIALGAEGSGESSPTTEGVTGAELPLGATVGSDGLPALNYTLEFKGGYFEIADFIKELDALVETKNQEVDAHGRLVTINGFTLQPEKEGAGLSATFQVTTYAAPSGEGLTAGASESGPEAEPAAEGETTEGESTE